jgi:hypothetical protein
MITDIQSIPDNYNYPCVIASISGKSFAYVALICGVLIVLIGVGFNYFFFSSKEPAIVEYIPSFKDILNGLLNGCDQNNWRDVYAKIMSEYLKLNPNYDTRYFPAHEIFDELEKTYARDTAPDIVRLKQLVNLDCCSGA